MTLKNRVAVIALEFRFLNYQGEYYTDSSFTRSFWERYLHEFDEVIVAARCKPIDSLWDGLQRVSDEKINFKPLPFYIGPLGFLKTCIFLFWRINRISESKATFILRAPGILSYFFGVCLFLKSKPFAIEVVGNPLTVFTKENFNILLAAAYQRIFSQTLRFLCNHAKAVSYVTKESLQKDFPPNPEAFSTSYSSVDLSDNFYFPPNFRRFVSDSFNLLFIGSLDQKYKGLNVLLSALSSDRLGAFNFSLLIIGEGKFKTDYERISAELGMRDKINFQNYLSNQAELIHFYRKADILIIPSLSEGLPRVAIEGAAASLPIIGSRVGGIPEILSKNALVAPNDDSELVDKILEFFRSSELRKCQAQRNFEVARQYSNAVLSDKRNEFYKFIRDFM